MGSAFTVQFLNPLAYYKSDSASNLARAALRQYIISINGEKVKGQWTKKVSQF